MENPTPTPAADPSGEAPEPESMSILGEFMFFLKDNKKWWLIPMVTMVGLIGLLLLFSATPVAPFIYTLF